MLLNIRRTYLPEWISWLVAGYLVWTLCISCNTRIEGCLDIQAENFDFSAERACDDCCTYPSMLLSLSQKWDDENFSNTDTFYDVDQQPYQIIDLTYFLSSWSWTDAQDNLYTVDSVEAACNGSLRRFTPDIITIDTRHFSYILGTIRQSPVIDSLSFFLGQTDDYTCLDPNDPDTPPNLDQQGPLWNPATDTLETLRLIIKKDLSVEVYDTLFVTTQFQFGLGYANEIEKGKDATLKLSVNYAQWFATVDIDMLSTFENSIVTHLPGSIQPTPE